MARYVLLRVEDDAEAAALLEDMRDYPDDGLLTPGQENRVHATTVDGLEMAVYLVDSLKDEDPCWFDHNGGCQAHGFLALGPGERCPEQDAKNFLALPHIAAMLEVK